MLGEACGEVRVVVLHPDSSTCRSSRGTLERVPRREVLRVQVVDDELGCHGEQPLEVLDALVNERSVS